MSAIDEQERNGTGPRCSRKVRLRHDGNYDVAQARPIDGGEEVRQGVNPTSCRVDER